MHTFSKTFSSVDDINSRWRCANAGRVVNRKICKLDCYANFLTITVGKGCGLKNWYFPRRLKLKLLKVNIGRKLVIYQLLTEKIRILLVAFCMCVSFLVFHVFASWVVFTVHFVSIPVPCVWSGQGLSTRAWIYQPGSTQTWFAYICIYILYLCIIICLVFCLYLYQIFLYLHSIFGEPRVQQPQR